MWNEGLQKRRLECHILLISGALDHTDWSVYIFCVWYRYMAQAPHESKLKLLDATLKVLRTKGYSATRIEDVCAEAG